MHVIHHPLVVAVVSTALGILFVLSYFFESSNKLFSRIILFCEKESFPGIKEMALIYAVILFIMAYGALVYG